MATANQLVTALVLDSQQYNDGLFEVSGNIKQTTEVIEVQSQSWASFSASVFSSIARIVGPSIELVAVLKKLQIAQVGAGAAASSAFAPVVAFAASIRAAAGAAWNGVWSLLGFSTATKAAAVSSAAATPPTFALGAAVNFLLSPVVLTLAAVAALTATMWYFTASGEAAGGMLGDLSGSLFGASSVWQSFLAGFVGTQGLDAINELNKAGKELFKSFSKLGDALLQPLRDAGFELGAELSMLTSFTTHVKTATSVVQSWAAGFGALAGKAREAFNAAAVAGTMLATGMNFDEATKAVKDQAEQRAWKIEAFNDQKSQEFAAEELKKIMKESTDVAHVASIKTIEGLDAETKALQRQIAQLQKKGEYTGEAKKQAEAMAAALAKQKVGIEDGTIESDEQKTLLENLKKVDDRIKSLNQSADELKTGKLAAFMKEMEGLTTSQLKLNEAREAFMRKEQADFDKGIGKQLEAARKQQEDEKRRLEDEGRRVADSLKSPAEKLKDEVARLTELKAEGAISADEFEAAKAKAKRDSERGGGGPAAFVKAGSSEAFSAIARAVEKNPIIPIAKDQLKEQKTLNKMIEARQPVSIPGRGPTLDSLDYV